MTVSITIFTDMFTKFDANLNSTITTGSANMISAITPLCSACFLIYLLLITFQYWRGGELGEPMLDFFQRMIGWVAVLTFGFNVTYYTTYVVGFFNGLGDSLVSAISGSTSTSSSLDTLASAYANAFVTLWENANGLEATAMAICFMLPLVPFTAIFLAIAGAYILLAKFTLAILLAIGPLFIACAMFPPTRGFFQNWIAQLVNCALITLLYAAMAALEISFATSEVPSVMLNLGKMLELSVMNLAFIVISLSMPGVAAALSGGLAISANAHTLKGPIGAAIKAAMKNRSDKNKGGSITGKG